MTSIGETFFEKTRYRHLGPSEQQQGNEQPALERPLADGLQESPIPLPAAEDIVPLVNRYDEWFANGYGRNGVYDEDGFKTITEAAEWVARNFQKYQDKLTC